MARTGLSVRRELTGWCYRNFTYNVTMFTFRCLLTFDARAACNKKPFGNCFTGPFESYFRILIFLGKVGLDILEFHRQTASMWNVLTESIHTSPLERFKSSSLFSLRTQNGVCATTRQSFAVVGCSHSSLIICEICLFIQQRNRSMIHNARMITIQMELQKPRVDLAGSHVLFAENHVRFCCRSRGHQTDGHVCNHPFFGHIWSFESFGPSMLA